jgi:hypothetical protein
MNRKIFESFTWLMWLALPLIALRYWLVWDRLPASMATHFDFAGQPNGWMPRDTSFWYAIGITAVVLVVFTAVLLLIHRERSRISDVVSWALLLFFYFVLGFVYFANNAVVDYNLNRHPVDLATASFLMLVAVVLLIGVCVMSKRGSPLPETQWIAEETHASPLLAVILLLPVALQLWILAKLPLGAMLVVMSLVCLLLIAVAAFAWTGFQYRFGPAGVEIRALGFRLRSIPLGEIKSYAVEPWSVIRGYGIRGIGNRRAYVWCNRGVLIKTGEDEVFLGYSEPERIIRHLDAIKQFAH